MADYTPERYFPTRYFAPRYFGGGDGGATGVRKIYVKVNGSWTPDVAPYVRANGAWSTPTAVWYRENGNWTQVWTT